MKDFVQEFISRMQSQGYSPDEKITPDDRMRRVRVNKERISSVAYQLRIDGDFAFGWFRSFRDGVTHKFVSTDENAKPLTDEERAARDAKIEAEKMARDAKREQEMLQVAEKARQRWASYGAPDPNHPYIQRKKIDPLGVKQAGDKIVVPVYCDAQLWSLQYISENGDKRFLSGGKINGGYASLIFKNDAYDTIVIAEGYATAVSIRMATGLPVVLAFNAGNISKVAAHLRSKFKSARIIIAADNDAFTMEAKHQKDHEGWKEKDGDDPAWQEWRDEGLLVNTGIIKATEAALEHECDICFPEFNDLKTKPTDFNDMHILYGLDRVKNIILSAQKAESGALADRDSEGDTLLSHGDKPLPAIPHYFDDMPDSFYQEMYDEEVQRQRGLYFDHDDQDALIEAEPENKNWREMLITDKHGNPKANSLRNIDIFLRHCPRFKNLFCYDEFSDQNTVISCPPWEDPAHFKVRALSDEDNTRLAIELEECGLKPNLTTLKKILDSVIRKNRRHPAREYFSRLKWDGKKRLDNWLAYYCGAEQEPAEYLAAVGSKWLIASVARVFRAGTKFDHMLILEGAQGAMKSTALCELATINGKAYFDDNIKVGDLGNEKTVPKLQGILILEIAELSGFRKKDADELKQEITTRSDRIVKKYANEPTEFPRQFVIAGTVNPRDGYLHDPTGNRRFWPVRIGDRIDLEALRKDKEQIWAEAVARYKAGEKLYLEGAVEEMAQKVQEERRSVDPWKPRVQKIVETMDYISSEAMEDIWSALQVKVFQRDKFNNERLSKIISELGFKWGRKMIGGSRMSMWVRDKERQPELGFEREHDF